MCASPSSTAYPAVFELEPIWPLSLMAGKHAPKRTKSPPSSDHHRKYCKMKCLDVCICCILLSSELSDHRNIENQESGIIMIEIRKELKRKPSTEQTQFTPRLEQRL